MSHKECDIFDVGSRKWLICRNESGLSINKTNKYRASWGLSELPTEKIDSIKIDNSIIPEFVFHGKSVGDGSYLIKNRLYGPGTELLKIYESVGAPTCSACIELAQEMNNWGITECRKKIEEIVLDILPRAKAWLEAEYPWAMRLIPNAVEECAIILRVRADVIKAINEAEKVITERKVKNLDIFTGEKKKVARRAVAAQSKISRQNSRKFYNRTPNIPLIGKPIDRERLQSHILYHIMPLSGDTEWVWRRHCQWLREVRPQFNGRLIIGIVTRGEGDAWEYFPPEAVKEELHGLNAEFIEAPNDTGTNSHRKKARQGLGEGVLFPKMLGMLETSDPDQVAFYGHCKGVSRPGATADSAVNLWAEAMFETVFRNQKAAIDALDTHGVCGSFRMRGGFRDGGPGVGSFWFYSGTFFGIRLVDAFKRNWDYMRPHYGCVEQWPRLNFDQHTQAACLFFDNVVNLYDENYWKNVVTPKFNKWKSEYGTY